MMCCVYCACFQILGPTASNEYTHTHTHTHIDRDCDSKSKQSASKSTTDKAECARAGLDSQWLHKAPASVRKMQNGRGSDLTFTVRQL